MLLEPVITWRPWRTLVTTTGACLDCYDEVLKKELRVELKQSGGVVVALKDSSHFV